MTAPVSYEKSASASWAWFKHGILYYSRRQYTGLHGVNNVPLGSRCDLISLVLP